MSSRKYKIGEEVVCLYKNRRYLKRGTIYVCWSTGMYGIAFTEGSGNYYPNNLANAKEFLQLQLEGKIK